VTASLPSMLRHLCICPDCDCCPHNNGVAGILLMHRCPCHRQAGVVALITMVSSPSSATMLFPLLQWRCRYPQAGVIALVVIASLSLSMCKHPCCHHDEVVALVVMALLPLMRRHLCHHCDGNCCPRRNGLSAIVELA
jgi:hypothetical protein